MNELVKELEDKAKCMLKFCDDPDLQEAAFYMMQAAQCVKSYEARKRKEEYHEQQTHLSGE